MPVLGAERACVHALIRTDLLAGGSGGERILQDLEEAGAFVVALDARRSWFRYHPLFADLTPGHGPVVQLAPCFVISSGETAVPPTVISRSLGSRMPSSRTVARNSSRNEGTKITCSTPVSASGRAARRGSQRSISNVTPPAINDNETDHNPSTCISD